jgi:hypothetical protein
MPALRIGSGRTPPGRGWVDYHRGIYLDVDTSSAGFTGAPRYFSTVDGDADQQNLVGASAIYQPTATGFRVYVQRNDGVNIDPPYAQQRNWHVNWVGVDNP